jgi:6-phosphogluconate dehydrogenase
MMQLIAEIYDFNRKAKRLSANEIAKIFDKANSGKSASFLAEITVKVLAHRDAETEKPLVDFILDKAAQKGTGGWTSIESIKLGAGAEMIGEAAAARSLSAQKDLRERLAKKMIYEYEQSTVEINWENVLNVGMLMAYAQGVFLIQLAAEAYKWPIDLAEVCRIWQGGCIIRSKLLIDLREAYQMNKNIQHLLESEDILTLIKESLVDFKNFNLESTKIGIAIPASASAYNYFLSITDKNTPANLIQGLRDFFGAHTFERVDRAGIFHENWTN